MSDVNKEKDRWSPKKVRERLEKGIKECFECHFIDDGRPNTHYNHCPILQQEMNERGTLLPFIPKEEETKEESITDKMSKKWYDE